MKLSVVVGVGTIVACIALSGCGRVGVSLLADDGELDFDAAIGEATGDELDGARPHRDEDAAADVALLDAVVDEDGGAVLDPAGADARSDAAEAEDAGSSAPDAAFPGDAGPPSCGGARALELCWYLSAFTTSCAETCSDRGGYDARMVRLVGTIRQGGRARNCVEVMTALGRPQWLTRGLRTDGRGLGCHLWNGTPWWIESGADFSPRDVSSGARIACACLE